MSTSSPIAVPNAPDDLPHPHRLVISVSHRSPTRTFYRASFQGEELLTHWEPTYSACRALLARGITGPLEFWHEGATSPALRVDIEKGAKLAVSEGERSPPKLTTWRPYEGPGGDQATE